MRSCGVATSPVPLLAITWLLLSLQGSFAERVPFGNGPYVENPNPAPEHSIGSKKTLVLRADFPDLPDTRLITTFQNTMTQVRSRLQRDSYDKTDLDVTVTAKCYRLPQTSVYYATWLDADGYHGWTTLMHDAQTLASVDYPVDPETGGVYDRVILAFPGLSNITASGMVGNRGSFGSKWVWMNGSLAVSSIVHELGHTYGSRHAGLWKVTDGDPISPNGILTEKGDTFDVMGGDGSSYTDFNPWVKNNFGWIGTDQINTLSTGGIYRVYRFDHQLATGVLALKIARDADINYWISLRRNWVNRSYSMTGAYVFWAYNVRYNHTMLLDTNTPNSDCTDSALQVGQTLFDSEHRIAITPVASGGVSPNEWMDIKIEMPDATPSSEIVFAASV